MRRSQLYAPTKKTTAKSESINAYLLTKAGFVSQVAAGVYALLPLALRVAQKIEAIIREEMNALGANETVFSALQPKQTWEASGRWQDPHFRQIIYFDPEAGMTFGATHEEPMVLAIKESVQSYRDLPVLLYQFQTKFRKELRAKSGLLRGREFRMKDLYSFHATPEDHQQFYEESAAAYARVFSRLGLETYRIKASGGIFSQEYSDEFQVICNTGEDEILANHTTKTGFNKEVEAEVSAEEKKDLERVRSIEVGNIFHLGTKYTDAFDVKYLDNAGALQPIYMGSYGIGVSRVLGTLAEIYNDEHGLKWPTAVAPFQIYLADLTQEGKAEALYQRLSSAGYDILWDERAVSAGEKLVDADLMGVPVRLVVSDKTEAAGQVELKDRSTGAVVLLGQDELDKKLQMYFP